MTTPILEKEQNKQGIVVPDNAKINYAIGLLVLKKKREPFISLRRIAEETGLTLKSVRQSVTRHKKTLEVFGVLALHKEASKEGRGKGFVETFLNKQQFQLLATFLKNTKQVEQFKVALIAAFEITQNENSKLKAKLESQSWQSARLEGKIQRQSFSDVIKEFSEYAILQGSSLKHGQYMLISKQIKNLLFNIREEIKDFRNYLSSEQLYDLSILEAKLSELILSEMEKGTFYRDIRALILRKIELFRDFNGVTQVTGLSHRDYQFLIC